MADTRLGKIGITVKEPWAADISFEVLDMTLNAVENGGDGCSYVALRDNIGVTPGTDPNTWVKSTQAGQSIYDLAVKYHHFVGTEEEFEAEYQAALQAARDAAAGASAVESQVEEAEAARVAAENARVSAEAARGDAETARQNAETSRATAETARQSAESNRASAETARVTAEQGRVSAESDRVSAEAARAAAETDRVSDFSALKTDMETAIGQADAATAAAVAINTQIQTAEEGRVSAEQGRVSAETARASAESARATAESGRATAETARATAEEQRATAEGQRVTAENARVSAEGGRASAESGRVSAEEGRVSAETARESQASSDHTRAESDHTIVQGYDTRLTTVEGEVSQLGQEVDEKVQRKVISSVNLFDATSPDIINARCGINGYTMSDSYRLTHPIYVLKDVKYKFTGPTNLGNPQLINRCDESGTFLSSFYSDTISGEQVTFTPNFSGFVRANIGGPAKVGTFMFCKESEFPASYVPYYYEENVGDNYGLGMKQVEQIEGYILPLKQDTSMLSIVENSAYNGDTGAITPYNGRYRTDKCIYNTKKVLHFTSEYAWRSYFWAGEVFQGEARNTAASPYNNTTHIAFVWLGAVSNVSYTEVLLTNSVIDSLDSNDATSPLSAKQGNILAQRVVAPINALDSDSTTAPLAAAQGKELARRISSINPEITIEGSGVAKNASAYGFLPANSADANAVALQSCVDNGGLILIDIPGTYEIGSAIYLDSNTQIVCAPGVYFKRAHNATTGKNPRHIFVNRGATIRSYNENIFLYGLNLLPNQELGFSNLEPVIAEGLRGLVAMFYVKNLIIDGLSVIDHTYTQYTLHVCAFDNIQLRNIHIETLKDGVHFGRGRGFVLEHCKFLTNDDAIALNAVDYPGSNAEAGWIEDGRIQDIVFLEAPTGSAFTEKRGVLILTGAWKDWAEGNTYMTSGDYCVSNGRLYQTYGEHGTTEIVSTEAPTHTSGTVTYSDGLTWLMKQDQAVGYNAGVRRITFKDIFFYRTVAPLFFFSSETGGFMRAFYPGSTLYKNTDIHFDNIQVMSPSRIFAKIYNPVDRITISNSNFENLLFQCIEFGMNGEAPTDMDVNLSFIGNNFSDIPLLYKDEGDWAATVNLVGSFRNGHSVRYNNITPTVVNNDLNP